MTDLCGMQAFAAGREGLLERLFPRLQLIRCICTGSMGKYVPLLRLLAPSTPLLPTLLSASEGTIGIAAELVECAEATLAAGARLAEGKQAADAGLAEGKQAADAGLAAAGPATASAPAPAPAPAPATAAGAAAAGAASYAGAAATAGATKGAPQEAPHSQAVAPPAPGKGGAARQNLPEALAFKQFSREPPEAASYIVFPSSHIYYEFLPLDWTQQAGEFEDKGEGGATLRCEAALSSMVVSGITYACIVTPK
jgi:hypothetical protein